MLMTTLIKIANGILSISDEALLIKPLRMIYNKDRTKDKEEYMQAASYLYFMYDPRSDYMYITDDNERDRIIIETEGLIKVKKDALLKEAIDIYKAHCNTSATELLKDSKIALDKIRDILRTADFTEEVNGKPKHTLNSLMSTIEKGIVLAGKIADAERLIRKDIEEEVAARGNAKRKILDDELL